MYGEMPTFDVSDVGGVPFTEIANGIKVTRFAPNAMMQIQSKRPVLLMLDEIGKAMRPVQNSCLRLLHERKIGEYSLPQGSIVFATTNLAAEGLGDSVQAHALNRCSFVTVRKPTADQWIPWAMGNGIHAVIISWVKRFPTCLSSYMDGVEGNPHIFYPSKPAKAFVTPRSLENASHIMWQRENLGHNATKAALAGCIGEAGAQDLVTFAETNDRLPSWHAITSAPKTTAVPLPKDFAANFILVFSAITVLDVNTFTAWMTYCRRLPKEYQGVFALNVCSSPKRRLAMENPEFVNWATKNQWLL